MTPETQGCAELLCRSYFSFHEGTSSPEQLIDQAGDHGLSHLGITDRDAVYGLPRAHRRVRERIRNGLPAPRLICGALLTISNGPGLVLLVQDLTGWARLCQLLTHARCRGELFGSTSPHDRSSIRKGWASIELDRVLEHTRGLDAIAVGNWTLSAAKKLRSAFGRYASLALDLQLDGHDDQRRRERHALSESSGLPLLATANVLMHHRDNKPIQDVLCCIRLKRTLDDVGDLLESNAARHLLSPERMRARFATDPRALTRGIEVARRCSFDLDALSYRYPRELVPPEYSPMTWLRELTSRGLRTRYPLGVPESVSQQIEHELSLIEELKFPAYFLTVSDTVHYAKSRGILCQGRGSAANSAVCYALGITSVDPATSSLLFERFISKERGEPPDIDVDFEHERREEVIQYIYTKYGRHRAAMVNEFISYRRRSAIRDVGKVMGLSLDRIDLLARECRHFDPSRDTSEWLRELGMNPKSRRLRLTVQIAEQMQGIPRHVGVHVGGFTISDTPLVELCPIEPASMDDRTVIQWDKDDIDIVGFVKVDILSLGMLTAIRKAMDAVTLYWNRPLEIETIPKEDPDVYEMLCRADTVGVFQVESRAQMSMLPRLRPRCWYDLVIQISLVRPGPIQGGMVHPYLKRRQGREPIVYAHPDLRPILDRTAGVPIFQEQVMAMAVAVGGFTPGQADALRRSMGAWRKRGGLTPLVRKLRDGMRERGIGRDYADQICAQIRGFGEYGFPESHAASFARLVYVSAWLKYHYPAAFTAALLDSQPMGFYSARSLTADALRHGVEIRPACIQNSSWNCTLEAIEEPSEASDASATKWAIRLGLGQIKGVRESVANTIVRARARAPFVDILDLARRTRIPRRQLSLLAHAHALEALEENRRQSVWRVHGMLDLPLFRGLIADSTRPPLPLASATEELVEDLQSTGLSVRHDPIRMIRPDLEKRGLLRTSDIRTLDNGSIVKTAGIISHRQRPSTASGILFMTMEDESGMINLVVKPHLFQRQRRVILGYNLLQVTAKVQREGDSISLLCLSFRKLPDAPFIPIRSRDFR